MASAPRCEPLLQLGRAPLGDAARAGRDDPGARETFCIPDAVLSITATCCCWRSVGRIVVRAGERSGPSMVSYKFETPVAATASLESGAGYFVRCDAAPVRAAIRRLQHAGSFRRRAAGVRERTVQRDMKNGMVLSASTRSVAPPRTISRNREWPKHPMTSRSQAR